MQEARESSYWLRLIRDSNALPADVVNPLIADATTLIRLLTAIVKTTQESLALVRRSRAK